MQAIISAVFEQLDQPNPAAILDQVAADGADEGWPGFTYYHETTAFWLEHQATLLSELQTHASECFEQDLIQLAASPIQLYPKQPRPSTTLAANIPTWY